MLLIHHKNYGFKYILSEISTLWDALKKTQAFSSSKKKGLKFKQQT